MGLFGPSAVEIASKAGQATDREWTCQDLASNGCHFYVLTLLPIGEPLDPLSAQSLAKSTWSTVASSFRLKTGFDRRNLVVNVAGNDGQYYSVDTNGSDRVGAVLRTS